MTDRHGRVVVLRALGLGDLLTAMPALRAIARAFPGHERTLVAPAPLAPLVALVDVEGPDGARVPAVDAIADRRGLDPLPAAFGGPDVAVNLHGRGPESHRVLLAAEPGRLVSFAHPDVPESAGGPEHREAEHEVARWCRMLAGHGVAADPAELRLPSPPPPARHAGATVLHPGAAFPARRGPAERWAAVARAERAAGREVVVTGSEAERRLAETVVLLADLPLSASLAGRTDVAGLAALVAHAGRVLCADTGIAHVATAFGTPSVVLFGPVPPSEWGPPADDPRHVALWSGRCGDPHGAVPDPGLLELVPADVLAAMEGLPDPAGAAAA